MDLQTTNISIQFEDNVIQVVLDLSNNQQHWICSQCQEYNPIDFTCCQKCDHDVNINVDDIGFLVEIAFAMLRDNMNTNVTIKKKDLITYKKDRERIIPHRGTKRLRDKYHLDKTCSICLEEMKLGNTWHETPCGHFFHPMCLRNVCCKFGPKAICPLCRSPV